MNQDSDCIFCLIASGKAPCFKVYENSHVLAFIDINPASHGHVLVIPKRHCEDIYDASSEAIRTVADATRDAAAAIRSTLNPNGLSIYQANGAAAGQTVFHYHVHLLPRVSGEELRMHGARRGDPVQLGELAKMLSDCIQGS